MCARDGCACEVAPRFGWTAEVAGGDGSLYVRDGRRKLTDEGRGLGRRRCVAVVFVGQVPTDVGVCGVVGESDLRARSNDGYVDAQCQAIEKPQGEAKRKVAHVGITNRPETPHIDLIRRVAAECLDRGLRRRQSGKDIAAG